MEQFDVLVIGGGAAGMAAALAAAERGRRTLLVERERALGGVLNQCLHHGFGLSWYGEDLSGVEYAERFVRDVENAPVTVQTGAEVLEIRTDKTALISAKNALFRVAFDQCVLAAGCRERPLGALDVAGTRPAGVFTAGTAQKLVNVGHYSVGKHVVILGSGDVGQIMARQLCQSGRRVAAMVEQAAALGGLARNRRDCVEAYHIPVLLRTTVEAVLGAERVTGVRLRNLDTGATRELACDTLITAVGLVPDRTLLPGGDVPPWLHLAGNCDYVHDIVDAVTREALALGEKL